MRSYPVKEIPISGSAVSEILQTYKHIDKQTSCYFVITGSNPANINRFRSHNGNIFLLVCVFIIVSYYRQLSADIMRIACLEPVLIQRICLGLRKKREATVPVQQFINFDKEEQQLNIPKLK